MCALPIFRRRWRRRIRRVISDDCQQSRPCRGAPGRDLALPATAGRARVRSYRRTYMNRADNAPAQVAAYLQQHETKSLLRFITCGSVDDGKSTLIGRLLHDTHLLLDDQVAALESDRSEEHTSELQSLMRISYAVFCLKKKRTRIQKQQN